MRCAAALIVMISAAKVSPALAADPLVPYMPNPGGTPVALLSSGLDYTDPAIAGRLARDGEGEMIGWDFAENDARPYVKSANDTPAAWGGDGTALARRLIGTSPAQPPVSLIPIRINPADPVTVAKALAFAAQTPARTVIVPASSESTADWEPFRLAAEHFKQLLIVVPASASAQATGSASGYPAAFRLANVLAVGSWQAGTPAPAEGGTADVLLAGSYRPHEVAVAAWPSIHALLAAVQAGDRSGAERKAALLTAQALRACGEEPGLCRPTKPGPSGANR